MRWRMSFGSTRWISASRIEMGKAGVTMFRQVRLVDLGGQGDPAPSQRRKAGTSLADASASPMQGCDVTVQRQL